MLDRFIQNRHGNAPHVAHICRHAPDMKMGGGNDVCNKEKRKGVYPVVGQRQDEANVAGLCLINHPVQVTADQ